MRDEADRTSSPHGSKPVDCLGIGFGPANIALAVAMAEETFPGSVRFLESTKEPGWQTGLLLEGADIQHNPLRDFVTPRNPRSPYGFLSYLQAVGRLFEFLNLDQPFPPRSEYAGYVRWVARQFDHLVSYDETVKRLSLTNDARFYKVETKAGAVHLARSVVFATGRSAFVPPVFREGLDGLVTHASRYMDGLEKAIRDGATHSFAIVGASQSAVEIALDLHGRFPDAQIHLICRGQGIKLKDTSPFTERIYFPEFVDYYHGAPEEAQARISRELWRSNYGAADHDIIATLALRFYEQKVTGRTRLHLHGYSEVRAADAADGGLRLTLRDVNTGETRMVDTGRAILATGYLNFGAGPERESHHPLLAEIAPHAARRSDGSLHVARDFRIEPADPAHPLPPLFVNGLCESTHGFGDAGSFSLLSVRSMTILQALRSALADASTIAA